MSRSLSDWLRWQETLHPRGIELGLQRVAGVAERLDLPWYDAVTITVAGTNGKGSSTHLADLIYREAGYRVGRYTSPHLFRYNERICIDGSEAGDEALCSAFAAIERVRADVPLTYFEFGTLAALWLFRDAAVDVQVLEVGLGGRLDAVNLVDADAALVTSIGVDHVDWLGPDRASIAREKAGIFRRGRPAIVAEPDPPSSLVATARDAGADLRQIGRDYDAVECGSGGFDWRGPRSALRALPLPGIAGAAQVRNAAGVLAVVDALQERRPVPEDAIRRALPALRLRGRCEHRGNLVLDVAHNREAALVLAAHLQTLPPAQPRVLVLGMLADKPHAEFLGALRPQVDVLICVDLPGPRGLPASELARRLGADAGARCCDNMHDALALARRLAGKDGRIVVTGSFLTVAAVPPEPDG